MITEHIKPVCSPNIVDCGGCWQIDSWEEYFEGGIDFWAKVAVDCGGLVR